MIDFTKYFSAAFLVNLKRREDRLLRAAEELDRWNIRGVERVEAVDGKDLPTHPSIGAGALGLYYTHLNIIKYAKAQGMKSVLILEDDCFYREGIKDLDKYMKALPDDWQILYFGSHHIQVPVKVNDRIVGNVQAFTTHSIAIKCDLFDRIIDDLENGLSSMDMQLDLYYSSKLQTTVPTYSFFPNVTGQFSSYSDIECEFKDYSDNMDENLNI